MADKKTTRRTRLKLDRTARQQLTALAEHHGSQEAAVREAIAAAHAEMLSCKKRDARIAALTSDYGELSEADREWVDKLRARIAAAKESQRS